MNLARPFAAFVVAFSFAHAQTPPVVITNGSVQWCKDSARLVATAATSEFAAISSSDGGSGTALLEIYEVPL